MGIHNLRNTSNVNTQYVKAADVIPHPDYVYDKTKGLPNDIALIELSTPAKLNKDVQIASLAEKEVDFVGHECVLSGWGSNSTGHSQHMLHEVSVSYVKMEYCLFRDDVTGTNSDGERDVIWWVTCKIALAL